MTPLTDRLAVTDDGWRLVETGWDPERAVALGSNFLAGNGYLGYRATSPEQGADDFVALVVSDTYDRADGHWTELTTAPNPLFVAARVDGIELGVAAASEVTASLDLRTGTVGLHHTHDVAGNRIAVGVERFASYTMKLGMVLGRHYQSLLADLILLPALLATGAALRGSASVRALLIGKLPR